MSEKQRTELRDRVYEGIRKTTLEKYLGRKPTSIPTWEEVISAESWKNITEEKRNKVRERWLNEVYLKGKWSQKEKDYLRDRVYEDTKTNP